MKLRPHFPGYDPQSAGIRVIHYLLDLLKVLGHEISDKEGPAIYPDCIPGNPLGAEQVVRFWCYYPKAYFGNAMVPKSELVLLYLDRFRESAQAQYDGVIPKRVFPIPSIEPGLFVGQRAKTIGAVWHIGKGDASKLPMNRGPFLIEKYKPQRPIVVEWLKKCRQFITLDNCTVTSVEAALCGAQTFLWDGTGLSPNPQPNPEQWVMKPERDLELAHLFAEEIRSFFNL